MGGKWKTHIFPVLFTLLFIGITIFSIEFTKEEALRFIVNTSTAKYVLYPYEEDDALYLFLPSYTEPSQVHLDAGSNKIHINGIRVRTGEVLSDLPFNEQQTITIGKRSLPFFLLRSANLPTLFIDTASGSMDYLEQDKNLQEPGNLRLVQADGSMLYQGRLAWVSGRGNQTWGLAKKGWGFCVEGSPVSLLGMSPANKWVLLANAYEATHGLRNFAAYNMAIQAEMEFSRDLQFVDLYLNGKYNGLYQLTEKIEAGQNALDIGNLDESNNAANHVYLNPDKLTLYSETDGETILKRWANIQTPEDCSGGYILERNYDDKLTDKPFLFTTKAGEGFVIRYPSVASRQEVAYISELAQHVENALMAPDYTDPDTGKAINELLDMDSWVRKYLVDEITKNEGAGTTSCYYYKKQGDPRLYAGPVWDYDKSLGTTRPFNAPDGLTYCSLHWSSAEWWRPFYDNPQAQKLIRRYYADIYRPYLEELLSGRLDQWAAEIETAYVMDSVRWESEYRRYPSIKLQGNSKGSSLPDALQFMKDWIQCRMEFLDRVWLKGEVFHNILIDDKEQVISVPDGNPLRQSPYYSGQPLWDAQTGARFDPDLAITKEYELVTQAPEPQ